MKNIVIEGQDEKKLIKELNKRSDVKAERIKRLLALPDLTKKENSPVKFLVDTMLSLPRFKDFHVVEFPKVVTVEENFDLLNTPKGHPSRSQSDTYYLDDENILRTQTTTMWPYCLRDERILKILKEEGKIGIMGPGIVYRKDEIDRSHYPAFNQIDGLYICKKSDHEITRKELEDIQADAAKAVFGDDCEYRFLDDTFPFTDPSTQIEVKFDDKWLELSGSGLVHKECLKNFGLDPEVYNGWAFGFGLDRWAMVKMEIKDIRTLWSNDERITSQFKDINSKFSEVSKFPETIRDISFIIKKDVNLNNYYEIVRDFANDLIEEVKLLDEYENDEKFGEDKKSYTFRITYRSMTRTLTNEEINEIQLKIREKTEKDLDAELR